MLEICSNCGTKVFRRAAGSCPSCSTGPAAAGNSESSSIPATPSPATAAASKPSSFGSAAGAMVGVVVAAVFSSVRRDHSLRMALVSAVFATLGGLIGIWLLRKALRK